MKSENQFILCVSFFLVYISLPIACKRRLPVLLMHLFIYALFNDTVSCTDCIAMTDRLISK
jgi:hypothetical protein